MSIRSVIKPSLPTLVVAAAVAIVAAGVFASLAFGNESATKTNTVPGTWRKLRPAPFAVPQEATSVWTGRQLIVFGRRPVTNPSVDVGEAYDPARDAWNRLSPPAAPGSSLGYKAVWTGKEMLVFGASHSVAFNPGTGKWRELRHSVPSGITVWTGREAIGWGGGCCGDAESNGAAYDPATGALRTLARSPLAPSQRPLGVWTGHELILFVSSFGPDGKRWPARLARAAAYNPLTNTWRRIAPLPVTGLRFAGNAVWDGREVLVVASGSTARSASAYNPATNHWRPLARMPSGRIGPTAVWTGARLLLWGGQNVGADKDLRDGLAYDPLANHWSSLPTAPLRVRSSPIVAWTGHALIVWGGEIGTPLGTSTPPRFPRDGASFTPAP
jgi:N-acetylneuraminic acid mutarotase